MLGQGTESYAAPKIVSLPPVIYGAQTHFAQRKGIPAISLSLIREAQIASIRDEVYWSQVETQKGVFTIPDHVVHAMDLAIRSGLKPLIILDYGNKLYDNGGMPISDTAQAAFVRYAEFVAGYFKGRVHHYEVWNEWNIGAGNTHPKPPFRGNPTDYVRLLAKTTAALKRIDPESVVLGGVIAGWDGAWIDDMLKHGAAHHLDGISIHPYSYNSGWKGRPEALVDWLGKLEENIRHQSGGKNIPLYLTEIGWPNHSGALGTQPEKTANYLSRLLILATSKPFIRGIWWYDFQDDGTDIHNAEHNFGLVSYDGSPKPAWFMLRDVLGFLHNARYVEQFPTESGIFAFRFIHTDGSSSLAIWTDREDKQARIVVKLNATHPDKMTLQQLGRGPAFPAIPLASDGFTFTLTADGTPWLLHGKFDSANVQATWAEIPSNGSFFLRR